METWPWSSCSWESGTWIWSRTGTWICCSGIGFGNESGSCCGICCVFCVSGWGNSFCYGVRNRRTSWGVLLAALHRSGNRGVCRTGPSGPATPFRPGARRPWRPSHPQRLVCRGTAQTRNPDFLSCSDLEGCKRPLHGHTSRIHVLGSRALFGTLSCPL